MGALGAGGMGEVYRARDMRLGRDVAIKSLPASLIGDAERVARFEREAQILAALNHPHIASIYGLEEISGSQFLVLELVEGDTLARRLEAGPLPLIEALTIARQVADALHAAHDKGIIHRDLKPANIAFTLGGEAKVLDFGLAKVLDPATSGDVSSGPTITAGTRAGVVLGTAAYMSPEQARGKPLDKRTDIWSLGSVLFEMLTGRMPFAGETISDTIAAVLERAPDWQLLPRSTPSRIQWLLRRCLEKDPKRRLHDIADARIEIDDTLSDNPVADSASPLLIARCDAGRMSTRERVAWLLAALGVAAAILLLVLGRGGRDRGSMETPRTYITSIVPEGVRLSAVNPASRLALSPDGRRLALIGADASGRSMLWVRPLHSRAAQPLAGTEGATFPFWSADSRFIGFLSDNKLRKIDASGGQVQTLCDASFGSTGAWNRDDVILFTPEGSSPLYRVSAAGGTAVRVTALDAANGESQHSYPFFLPDGRHFVYFVVGSKSGGLTSARGIYLGALGSDAPGRLLVDGAWNPKYANGHLIFLREGVLRAQPFDPNRLELGDHPRQLAEGIQTATTGATETSGAFSVSETGLLAYQTASLVRSQLAWFDRAGNQIAQLGEQAEYSDVALSPDDSRVAVSMVDPAAGTRDLWVFDAVRGTRDRFTFDPGDDFGPNWLRPAGDRIVFSSRRRGSVHLYEKGTAGTGAERLLVEDALGKFNPSSSGDGKFLTYVAGGGIIGRSDIWIMPMPGGPPTPFLDSTFVETQPQFSPDGRWVAYTSRESGQYEVYITSFPDKRVKSVISVAGGSLPRWNRNAKEILYLALDNTLIATPVNGAGPRFEVGTGRPLFRVRPRPTARLDAYPYDLTSDGKKILVNTFVEESTTNPITLVVNWAGAANR